MNPAIDSGKTGVGDVLSYVGREALCDVWNFQQQDLWKLMDSGFLKGEGKSILESVGDLGYNGNGNGNGARSPI